VDSRGCRSRRAAPVARCRVGRMGPVVWSAEAGAEVVVGMAVVGVALAGIAVAGTEVADIAVGGTEEAGIREVGKEEGGNREVAAGLGRCQGPAGRARRGCPVPRHSRRLLKGYDGWSP